MGIGALGYIELGLSAAQMASQYNTAKDRDNEVAAGIRRNMALQKQAKTRIAQAVQQQRQSTPQKAQTSTENNYLKQLRANQEQATRQLNQPQLGEHYAQRAGSDADGQQDYINQLATAMAAMNAPSLQRQQEAFNFGDLKNELGVIGNEAQSNDFLTKLRASSLQPNPWLGAAAQGVGALSSYRGAK